MDVIRRHRIPHLRNPIAVVAFGGWNDACDVASTSAEFILDAHDETEIFAEVEPDPFYDFQQQRPTVNILDGVSRSIQWPGVSFTAVFRPRDDRDLVVVTGQEPNFLWKTFARSLVEVLNEAGVDEVLLAGAYVGAVGHRDPVTLSGVGTDLATVIRSGLDGSTYRGPTGIVGVVQGACPVRPGMQSLEHRGHRPRRTWPATPTPRQSWPSLRRSPTSRTSTSTPPNSSPSTPSTRRRSMRPSRTPAPSSRNTSRNSTPTTSRSSGRSSS